MAQRSKFARAPSGKQILGTASGGSLVRVQLGEPSLGDEITPHAETLGKSRVSVIFIPKSMFTAFDTSFRTCWTRTYDSFIDFC